MSAKTIEIESEYDQLLRYIVLYRKLRGSSSKKGTVQQLTLAYAKQLVTGMPEPRWRANMIALINQAEELDENNKRKAAREARKRARELRKRISPPK